MATRAEQYAAAVARVDAINAELAEGAINRPDFSDQGRTVAFNAYRDSLIREKLQIIKEELPLLQDPYEIHANPDYC